MKGMLYNLKILKSDNEYLHFNEIDSNEVCNIIVRELKNLYKVDNLKINGDTVYNLINRRKFCDKNMQNYCFVEKSQNKQKTKKQIAKEKAEQNRLNRDKEKYERNQRYHLKYLVKKVTKIFDEIEKKKEEMNKIEPLDKYARIYNNDGSELIFS